MATKQLVIEKCVPKKTGTGQYGEWTLYEVIGRNSEGVPLEGCVAFKDFSGQSGEFEVTAKVHPEHGTSYTVKKPGGGFPPLGPRVEALEKEVAALKSALNVGGVSQGGDVSAPRGGDLDSIPF